MTGQACWAVMSWQGLLGSAMLAKPSRALFGRHCLGYVGFASIFWDLQGLGCSAWTALVFMGLLWFGEAVLGCA